MESARIYPKFLDTSDLENELHTFLRLKEEFRDCKSLEDVCRVFAKDDYLKNTAFRTSGVERSFSSLKLIKSRLRRKMSDEHLMLIYIHNSGEIDIDTIIDIFKHEMCSV